MVSETLKLTNHERLSLTNMLLAFVENRGPVFAAVGAESTKQALGFAVEAEKEGCDAVMAVPPLTAKLSESHLVDHFRALADGIGIPVIVQDASGYVGQSIPIPVCVKLLERYGPEKILFKPEAAPNGPTLSALRDATNGRATMFEGSGGIFLIDSFRRGIAGTMPGMELLDERVWKATSGDEETFIVFPSARPSSRLATASGSGRLPRHREVSDGEARTVPQRAPAQAVRLGTRHRKRGRSGPPVRTTSGGTFANTEVRSEK